VSLASAGRQGGARRLYRAPSPSALPVEKIPDVFTPAAPVRRRDLFAGRQDQIRALSDAIAQPGQHAILHGERGVGKTSLAAITGLRLGTEDDISVRVNCDASDTFASIWRKVLSQVQLGRVVRKVGFTQHEEAQYASPVGLLPTRPGPDDIASLLRSLARDKTLAIFLDEYDRVTDASTRTVIADTLKTFSDQFVPATIVLVGVADTVEQLVGEHSSIERGLLQIRMPRMSAAELHEILRRGLTELGMSMVPEAGDTIATLSQGLPHYVHLLAQHATRSAAEAGRLEVAREDVDVAIKIAVSRAEQTVARAYHRATLSTRETIYPDVVLACALASVDELGYFAASDVRRPLSLIKQRSYTIAAYAEHLVALSDPERGLLQRIGSGRTFKYRFRNPLLRPYVVLRAMADGRVMQEVVNELDRSRRVASASA
jgi:Cdc6-like AAA superfamily ATPase